ncbi:MAG: DUF2339 domain-containing protein, partial [Chlorobiales bacterium]|nr:DUF2339 domain-containing protein [Chlorobiales bacterium]
GLACLFGSEWVRGRRQPWAANAMAGAGVVILYAAIWAAQHLYQLISAPPAFVVMALITVACGTLALARQSLLIAVLGLMGGFATPLLVAPQADQPLTLFTYVLILDAVLLWLARRQRWPVLAILCLVGTAVHQSLWIIGHMDAERLLIGLVVLAVFALAFLLLGPARHTTEQEGGTEQALWRWCRAGGVLLPFVFALHMAGTARLTAHPTPLAVLLLMLSICACWQARRQPEPLLAPVAAGATLGIMTLWFMTHTLTVPLVWEAAAVCAGLALAYAVMAKLALNDDVWPQLSAAQLILGIGLFVLLVLASPTRSASQLWPWLAGWSAQAALLLWHAQDRHRAPLQLVTGLGMAAGLLLFAASHYASLGFRHEPSLYLAVVMITAVVFQALGLLTKQVKPQLWANHTASATALTLLLV